MSGSVKVAALVAVSVAMGLTSLPILAFIVRNIEDLARAVGGGA